VQLSVLYKAQERLSFYFRCPEGTTEVAACLVGGVSPFERRRKTSDSS